ncbi:MAG TPA: hypothetical protein VJ916_07290 [Anaerovoracaceae bacterium]|nr:hypothetical protein [Anaerovoracaceae bacterium]
MVYAAVKLNEELKEKEDLDVEEEMKILTKYFNNSYDIYNKL